MVEQKQRKKRRSTVLLLNDYNCLSDSEVIKTLEQIGEKLIKIFKNHIGSENSITPVEVFESIFMVNPSYMDIFKRTYWWNVLKTILRKLRSEEKLFVINRGGKLFVLQTQEEANGFKGKIDRDIERMKELKKKADKWVRNKKWKNI